MRPFKLMPLFSIIFLLGGLPLFPSYHAYACCDPCTCWWWCDCAGVNNCPQYQCLTDDSASLQLQSMNSTEKLYVSGSYVSAPAPVLRAYSIDRLIARSISGQCDKDNYALKFFRSAEDRLKFELDFLNYKATEDDNNVKIVARQMP